VADIDGPVKAEVRTAREWMRSNAKGKPAEGLIFPVLLVHRPLNESMIALGGPGSGGRRRRLAIVFRPCVGMPGARFTAACCWPRSSDRNAASNAAARGPLDAAFNS
jgi:hypothetical protein